MKKQKGITLLESLLTLTIFSAITYSTMSLTELAETKVAELQTIEQKHAELYSQYMHVKLENESE